MGIRVSRWTLSYFAVAVACFVLVQAAVTLGWSYPALGVAASPTLAVVHLMTLGWLTLLMLGALHQFVPVITERSLASDQATGWALALILAGLAGMVLGFLSIPGGPLAAGDTGKAGPLLMALPVGGAVVATSLTVAVVNLAAALWSARPLVLPARFVALGLAFLLLTAGMGVTLAIVLARSGGTGGNLPATWAVRLLRGGLVLHLATGIGGWFTLTAMGVAYKLLAMFTLAPEDRGTAGRWVLRMAGGGLALAWGAGFLRWFVPGSEAAPVEAGPGLAATALAACGTAGWVAAGAGVVLYLVDMARLYRDRRRRALELNARYAPWALGALGLGVVLLGAGALTGRVAAWAPAVTYVLLFGWLSGLGLTQLYKIVPFLTWLERFGPQLGKGPSVRVQDLVNEPRARPWFGLYFGAVAGGTAAALAGWTGWWRGASAVALAATLAIARELWRARHSNPEPRRMAPGAPMAPLPAPTATGTSTATGTPERR